MSYVLQETWKVRGKRIYGVFHDGSRRMRCIDKDALYATFKEAREALETIEDDGDVDESIEADMTCPHFWSSHKLALGVWF